MSDFRDDPEFQEIRGQVAEAIGRVVVRRMDSPIGVMASYWALLGMTSAMRATIEGVEFEERETQGMKVAAHEAMREQAMRWQALRN